MDVFFEQIVVRKPSNAGKIIKLLTIVFGIVAVLIMLTISFLNIFGAFSFIFLPLAFGTAVLLYFSVRNTYIEYEYSLTNGSLDIDKIKGKRKRERIVSVECSNFEEFGEYNKQVEDRMKNRDFGGFVFAANRDSDNLLYAVSKHKRLGTVMIIIEPNEKVRTGLKKFIPRQVQGDVLGGH